MLQLIKAQERKEVFRDKSGDKSRDWLGESEEIFYELGINSIFLWIIIILENLRWEIYHQGKFSPRNDIHYN